jgi:NADPH:quinone reductase-like Zn-dependent oxidoreductase
MLIDIIVVVLDYSSINYKDGLAINGKSHIIKQPAILAGIDLA